MSLAGSFLVARPTLRDPNFAHTVIFLLAHNNDGAFGLVVNRQAEAEGLPWPLFVGGPCPAPGLLMLHGQAEWAGDSSDSSNQEVAPGIFTGDAACLDRAGQVPPPETPRFRVFTGYSGWGEGQLDNELAEGAWVSVAANGSLLFDTPPEELWDRLAPPSIPQPSLN